MLSMVLLQHLQFLFTRDGSLFGTYRFLCFNFSHAEVSRCDTYFGLFLQTLLKGKSCISRRFGHEISLGGGIIFNSCLALVLFLIVSLSSLVIVFPIFHSVLAGNDVSFGPTSRTSPFFVSHFVVSSLILEPILSISPVSCMEPTLSIQIFSIVLLGFSLP